MAELQSERLAALWRREIDAFEAAVKEEIPLQMAPRPVGAPGTKAMTPKASRLALVKERIDLLVQLTRALEKLLELRRIEMLAAQGGAEDEAETARLRAELLGRLRGLDARRRTGPTLFDATTGAFHGDGAIRPGEVATAPPVRGSPDAPLGVPTEI